MSVRNNRLALLILPSGVRHFPKTLGVIAGCNLGVALFVVVNPGRAQTSERSKTETTQAGRIGPIKLRDVGIDQILELLERWTGKSLLRPPALPTTTVSLNLNEAVTKEQAIRAIETLLNLNGVALTPLDDHFLKVTTLAAAKAEAPELIAGSTLEMPPTGQVMSKLFKLKFLRVTEFVPQVTGLLNAAGGAPAVFEKANAVLITDSLSTLQRIETLVQQLDRPVAASLQPKFYQLSYAKAGEVVNKLHSMFAGPLQNQLGTSTSYTADDRTNQIVLFSDPDQHAVFDDLIAKLDVRSGQDTRNVIIYLKHATAKDVAGILTQMVSGQTKTTNAGQEPNRSIGADSSSPTSDPNAVNASAEKSTPAIANPKSTAIEPSNQFSSSLTILAEERSNALVISGTVDDIRLVNDLVSRIDVLLAQVRIEVVIAEVILDNNDTTGISALGLQISGDKLVGFSGSLPGAGIAQGTVTRANPTGTPPVTVTGPWDLAAQISLAATPRKTNSNILSVPNIITTHNREGKIFVGQEVPVISGYLNTGTTGASSGTNGAGAGYLSTVNSKDIGIQLTVKPLIGADGSVQLEIKQEVNDILGNVMIDGNSQPIIGRRSTESFVSARSGDIIVLGGLQRSSTSRSTSRLGPIPFLGDLLGARTRDKTRTDLIFFLRPTILSNTPLDNEPALEEIKKFPKDQRKEVQSHLQPTVPGS